MSNFRFFHSEFPGIYRDAAEAEKHAITAPRYCAILCRSAMEKAIHWLYQNDHDLVEPYDTKLASLIHESSFKDLVDEGMFREINVIRLTGNNAAHGKNVNRNESLVSLKNLFRFLSFLSKYYSLDNPVLPAFDESLIPDGREDDKSKKEIQKIVGQLEQQTEQLLQERTRQEEQAVRLSCYGCNWRKSGNGLRSVKRPGRKRLTKTGQFRF